MATRRGLGAVLGVRDWLEPGGPHDLNYKRRDFHNFAAYAEAKVATVLYAKELAERLDGTAVTVFSLHPGWARSNFGSGGSLPIQVAMAVMGPFTQLLSDSNQESAQSSVL